MSRTSLSHLSEYGGTKHALSFWWTYLQVRDTALGIDTTDSIPKSDVNREYFAEEHDRKVSDCFKPSHVKQELSMLEFELSPCRSFVC